MKVITTIVSAMLATGLMVSTAAANELWYAVEYADGTSESRSVELVKESDFKKSNAAAEEISFGASEANAGNRKLAADHFNRGCLALQTVLKGMYRDMPIERKLGGIKIERENVSRIKIGGVFGAYERVCSFEPAPHKSNSPNDNSFYTPAGGTTNHNYCNTFKINDADNNGEKHEEGNCL